ncbi:extensin-like [Aplysia californica]|uniref:Extensin-like n=1 Tax=Aplysia californica TaxID=6500 RepID=A0ABM1VY85_APLCA|nr:extensin-like [Aplysia californica]
MTTGWPLSGAAPVSVQRRPIKAMTGGLSHHHPHSPSGGVAGNGRQWPSGCQTSHPDLTPRPHRVNVRRIHTLTPRPHPQTSHPDLTPRPNPQTSPPDLTARPHPQTSPSDLTPRPHPQTSPPDLTPRPHRQTSPTGRFCNPIKRAHAVSAQVLLFDLSQKAEKRD